MHDCNLCPFDSGLEACLVVFSLAVERPGKDIRYVVLTADVAYSYLVWEKFVLYQVEAALDERVNV